MELTSTERADLIGQLDEYLWGQYDIPFTPAMPPGSPAHILALSAAGREIIDFIDQSKSTLIYVNSCRGSSKSANSLWRAIRNSNHTSGYRSLFLAATMGQMEEVFDIHWEALLQTCPRSRRPRKAGNRPRFKFPNGSLIAYSGMDQTKGRTKRGGQWDDIYCDEIGFWLEGWGPIMGGLYSQVERRKRAGKIKRSCKIILQSTPPETTDHDAVLLFDYCVTRGAAIEKTILDYPEFYTSERIQEITDELGGANSTQFQREMMCRFVTEKERAVVPEFEDALNVVESWDRPEFFDAYIFLDFGAKDFTQALFCFYDYHRATLVCEGELVFANKSIDVIADGIKAKKNELWGEHKETHKIADNNMMEIMNLSHMFNLHFMPANDAKTDKDATLNQMRSYIKAGKVKFIKDKCPITIHQFKNAIWNRARTSYERSTKGGHQDGIDALAYGAHYVQWRKDPFPADHNLNPHTHLMYHHAQNQKRNEGIMGILRPKYKIPIRR